MSRRSVTGAVCGNAAAMKWQTKKLIGTNAADTCHGNLAATSIKSDNPPLRCAIAVLNYWTIVERGRLSQAEPRINSRAVPDTEPICPLPLPIADTAILSARG
jgi:hypothetical protein